jgi:hypothetical protein
MSISFTDRLKHTIAQLEEETASGQENWTPTIDALRATLNEVEQEESDNRAVAASDWAESEDLRMEAESDDFSWEADEDRRMESL